MVYDKHDQVCRWQPGENYKLAVPAQRVAELVVLETWDENATARHICVVPAAADSARNVAASTTTASEVSEPGTVPLTPLETVAGASSSHSSFSLEQPAVAAGSPAPASPAVGEVLREQVCAWVLGQHARNG